jgi:hypothetical protein
LHLFPVFHSHPICLFSHYPFPYLTTAGDSSGFPPYPSSDQAVNFPGVISRRGTSLVITDFYNPPFWWNGGMARHTEFGSYIYKMIHQSTQLLWLHKRKPNFKLVLLYLFKILADEFSITSHFCALNVKQKP